MKSLVFFTIIGFALFLQSCGVSDIGKWYFVGLSELKIEGSSKVIRKYSAWGGRDTNVNGLRLMDSTEIFQVNKYADLPFKHLITIPNENVIRGISSRCENSCGKFYKEAIPYFTPIDIQTHSKSDINIEHIVYQYKGYSKTSRGLGRFEFDNFTETRDSIYFFNLDDVKSKKHKHLDTLKVKKRMVELQSSNNDNKVALIVIEDTEIDEKQRIINRKTYHLRPKTQIKIEEFSNYGIFKPIRIKNTPNKR